MEKISPSSGAGITLAELVRSKQSLERLLSVNVVFTQEEATIAVLREAGRLSHQLSARVCLLIAVPVGYPAPLTSAWGRVDAAKRRGRALTNAAGAPMDIRVFLCRDSVNAFSQYLPPNAVVLVGGRRRWWRSREQRLAARLTASGLNVLFIKTKECARA